MGRVDGYKLGFGLVSGSEMGRSELRLDGVEGSLRVSLGRVEGRFVISGRSSALIGREVRMWCAP